MRLRRELIRKCWRGDIMGGAFFGAAPITNVNIILSSFFPSRQVVNERGRGRMSTPNGRQDKPAVVVAVVRSPMTSSERAEKLLPSSDSRSKSFSRGISCHPPSSSYRTSPSPVVPSMATTVPLRSCPRLEVAIPPLSLLSGRLFDSINLFSPTCSYIPLSASF